MRTILAVALVLLLGMASVAAAQDPGPSRPSPGPSDHPPGSHDGPSDGLSVEFAHGSLEVGVRSREQATLVVRGPPGTEVQLFVRDVPEGWAASPEKRFVVLPREGVAEVHYAVGAGPDAAREGLLSLGYRAGDARGSAGLSLSLKAPEDGRAETDVQGLMACVHGDSAQGPPPDPESQKARIEACCKESRGASERIERRCELLLDSAEALARRQHIDFVPMDDGFGFEALSVGGTEIIERVRYEPLANTTQASLDRSGARIRFSFDPEGGLALHDNPTGLLRFRAPGDLAVRFPEGTVLVPQGDHPWRVEGSGWSGLLWAENATFEGREGVASGSLSFHLLPPQPPGAPSPEVREHVRQAVERRHVGAEVSLRPGPPEAPVSDRVQVLAYDEVEVTVDLPDGMATEEDPIRVEVGSDLEEGRTIVLDIDPALLEGDARLRYFDVTYEDGVRHEAEVVFLQADSLADVMDPTDDGIQPEYWIVTDGQGVHVLVSVPAWSIHAITVSSVAGAVLQPSVLIGIGAGAAGTALAAAALLRPRRREK